MRHVGVPRSVILHVNRGKYRPFVEDVTNTGNGERGTGNGERGTGNGSLGTSVQR